MSPGVVESDAYYIAAIRQSIRRGQRFPLQGYSGQPDSFPRERQLQSILTGNDARPGPAARFLFRFSNVR